MGVESNNFIAHQTGNFLFGSPHTGNKKMTTVKNKTQSTWIKGSFPVCTCVFKLNSQPANGVQNISGTWVL